jgi:hypothetical protein
MAWLHAVIDDGITACRAAQDSVHLKFLDILKRGMIMLHAYAPFASL